MRPEMTDRPSRRMWPDRRLWKQDAILGWLLGALSAGNLAVALAVAPLRWWLLPVSAVLFVVGAYSTLKLARATRDCEESADDLLDFYQHQHDQRTWGRSLN